MYIHIEILPAQFRLVYVRDSPTLSQTAPAHVCGCVSVGVERERERERESVFVYVCVSVCALLCVCVRECKCVCVVQNVCLKCVALFVCASHLHRLGKLSQTCTKQVHCLMGSFSFSLYLIYFFSSLTLSLSLFPSLPLALSSALSLARTRARSFFFFLSLSRACSLSLHCLVHPPSPTTPLSPTFPTSDRRHVSSMVLKALAAICTTNSSEPVKAALRLLTSCSSPNTWPKSPLKGTVNDERIS